MGGVKRDPARVATEEEPDQQREGREADNSANKGCNTSG